MGISDDDLNLKMKRKRSEPADPEALTKEDEDYLNQEDTVSLHKNMV